MVIAAINSVIGAYYYLRVIISMYFWEPSKDYTPQPVAPPWASRSSSPLSAPCTWASCLAAFSTSLASPPILSICTKACGSTKASKNKKARTRFREPRALFDALST